MEAIEVNFKYTEQEFLQASRKYLFTSKTIRKTDILIAVLLLILALICLFPLSLHVFGIVLLVFSLLYLAIICIVYFIMPRFTFRQNAKFQEEYHLTFSNHGIRFETDTINSDLQWNVYTDFLENENFYYLIQTKKVYSIIPKRAFADNEKRLLFRELVLLNLR